MANSRDLTGQVFNRLTVLHRTTQEEHPHKTGAGYHILWTCQCECGNITFVQSSGLRSGKTVSCGCYSKEVAARLAKKLGEANRADLTGQRFGKLIAQKIYKTGPENERGVTEWECLCDCGKTTYVRAGYLLNGHTKSCGCLRDNYLSPGASRLLQILQKEKLQFSLEKNYEDLHNGLYRFDFCVENFKNHPILIEYDSNLHFEYVPRFHKNKQNFKAAQERDRIKNSYALSHGIPLYRIPYWDINKINTLNDITQPQYLVQTRWHNDIIYREYLKCGGK